MTDAVRNEFEAWCVKRWGCDRGDDNFLRYDDSDKHYAGQYRKGNVEFAWCAWAAARAALSEQPCEPDMRHPKIKALIGSNARRSIELSLVEQLLDDPDCDLTALDMEYWNGLHDKLLERLTAAHPAPVERVALSDEQIDAAKVVPDCIRDELPDDLAVRRVQIWAAGLVAAERKAWVEALVAAGLMTKREVSALSGWDAVYIVTAEGKAAARSKTHNVGIQLASPASGEAPLE